MVRVLVAYLDEAGKLGDIHSVAGEQVELDRIGGKSEAGGALAQDAAQVVYRLAQAAAGMLFRVIRPEQIGKDGTCVRLTGLNRQAGKQGAHFGGFEGGERNAIQRGAEGSEKTDRQTVQGMPPDIPE